jgi:hypothetical protein
MRARPNPSNAVTRNDAKDARGAEVPVQFYRSRNAAPRGVGLRRSPLGVSKSSIREVVKMLQAMGVVEVRRGQGTLVRLER